MRKRVGRSARAGAHGTPRLESLEERQLLSGGPVQPVMGPLQFPAVAALVGPQRPGGPAGSSKDDPGTGNASALAKEAQDQGGGTADPGHEQTANGDTGGSQSTTAPGGSSGGTATSDPGASGVSAASDSTTSQQGSDQQDQTANGGQGDPSGSGGASDGAAASQPSGGGQTDPGQDASQSAPPAQASTCAASAAAASAATASAATASAAATADSSSSASSGSSTQAAMQPPPGTSTPAATPKSTETTQAGTPASPPADSGAAQTVSATPVPSDGGQGTAKTAEKRSATVSAPARQDNSSGTWDSVSLVTALRLGLTGPGTGAKFDPETPSSPASRPMDAPPVDAAGRGVRLLLSAGASRSAPEEREVVYSGDRPLEAAPSSDFLPSVKEALPPAGSAELSTPQARAAGPAEAPLPDVSTLGQSLQDFLDSVESLLAEGPRVRGFFALVPVAATFMAALLYGALGRRKGPPPGAGRPALRAGQEEPGYPWLPGAWETGAAGEDRP